MAGIARLSLSPRDEKRVGRELSSILDYFRTLDGAKVQRTASLHGKLSTSQLREDQPRPTDSASILAGVPHRRGRFVRAPKVF